MVNEGDTISTTPLSPYGLGTQVTYACNAGHFFADRQPTKTITCVLSYLHEGYAEWNVQLHCEGELNEIYMCHIIAYFKVKIYYAFQIGYVRI